MWVTSPGLDHDSVVWLETEVLSDVIDDEELLEVPADLGEVLDGELSLSCGVVPVQPVADVIFIIQSVQDPVSILGKK